MTLGKSIRLFLVDGTPGGLVTAEIMNWTGHVLAGPRSDLAALLRREEAHRTGVYLLVGDAPDMLGGVQIYIGEGDDIGARLSSHSREKDFWQRCLIVTSKDSNLTKAHARYLEARLIDWARSAQRSHVTNVTAPIPIALPEADVSDMESFLSQVEIVLPVLGINVLRSAPRRALAPLTSPVPSLVVPAFTLKQQKESLVSHAMEVDGEFTVLAGSHARSNRVGSSSYDRLRDQLAADGTIDVTVTPATFSRDFVFASPSAAASVITGRASNGRTAWVEAESGMAYGDWQIRDL
jgi:hypothetical protein